MTCHRVRKLIPLAIGDDLRPRLGRAVRAHIDACPSCRKELEEFREAMARLKAVSKKEGVPDWSEDEWNALMARIRPSASETKQPAFLARPRWAAASVLGAVIGLAVLSVLFRDTASRRGRIAPEGGPAVAAATREQDVVAVTMVSQETGLQVVWFFDKNFEWKGDK